MKPSLKTLILVLILSGCMQKLPDEAFTLTGDAKPHIMEKQQNEFLNFLKGDKNAPIESRACYSYSGMVDAGQILFLFYPDKQVFSSLLCHLLSCFH